MKKAGKITLLALAATVVLSGVAAVGKSIAKQVDIYYRNIKININGEEYTPKNVDGETVEPFIYEGTTYLPVRAVADALGKDVEWDDETSTVIITDKKSDASAEESENNGAVEENPALIATSDYNAKLEERVEKVVPKEDLDKNILLNVGGLPISEAVVKYAVTACTSFYKGADDEATNKAINDEIDEFYRINAAVVNVAEKHGIEIEETDFNKTVTEGYNELIGYYGDDTSKIIQSYTAQTTNFYFVNQCYNLLYQKLFDYFMADEDFSAQVKAETLDEMVNGKQPYVRAKHILVCFPETGELTDEQKAETLEKINGIAKRLENGEDFDELMKEYGEDPGAVTYPGGYYFTTGEMVEPFEKTAFALKENEVSAPVETTFGYHIIMRLPLDTGDGSLEKSDMYSKKGYELLRSKLIEESAEYEVIYAESYEQVYRDYGEEAKAQFIQ